MFDGNIQINYYDAEGLRAEMEENGRLAAFIFNPAKEVITETENRTVLRYIRGSELIARNTDAVRMYYHYASDEMGSITHVTDEEGNLLNRYEYDAWGNLTTEEEQVSNRFKYMGEQFDPVTQQYYLRARFYNPALARFMQEDTFRGDGLNLYAYCANNPVRYVDPSGHWCEKKEDIYRGLVEKNGLDINNIDPDTKQRLMAEAANIVKGLNVEQNKTPIELHGTVLPEQNRPAEPVTDAPNDNKRGKKNTTGDNSRILANNLEREGRTVGEREAAAHIVASTGSKRQWKSAADSRKLLSKYDIDINDAANGLPLGHPRQHNLTHNRNFHEQVNSRLHSVETNMINNGYGRKAIRSALRQELRKIGKEFENGIRN